jgi:predicted dehydrogenase
MIAAAAPSARAETGGGGTMRFGLVGTGPWARSVHGPGLAGAADADLVAVWGRTPEKAQELADSLGVAACTSYDELLDRVDAVAFAVPPDVQAELAGRAARAGRHLLLDKPVATTAAAADDLAAAAAGAGVASVVFFTDRFAPVARLWFEEVAGLGGWLGGWSRWLAALDAPGNPYGESAWRRERGALWDIGPHALSTLAAALGPVAAVSATAGEGDLVHLVLAHDSGATSTATLTLFAPPAAASSEVTLWGEHGLSTMPPRADDTPGQAFARAVTELVEAARSGADHPVDVAFGARVVGLLEDADRQLSSSRPGRPGPSAGR